ncbi:MAG: hypothetical protein SFX18_13870 [Pirellulales bacterium]|nr:hypothetical protein [Pirellulales bacterium]
MAALVLTGCSSSYPDPRPDLDAAAAIRTKWKTAAPAADATEQAAPVGTGWGTLKGRFVWDGEIPVQATLNCDKDSGTCCKEKILDESLVVGSDKGVANIIVFLRSKASRIHPETEKIAETPVVLDNVKCVFRPHVSALWTKQKLILKNSDDVGHNTNYSSTSQGFNELLAPNSTKERTLAKGENAPAGVSCNIHGWMAARLLVRDNPYFAVTKADGTFEIPNLPAGEELEFKIWHEKNDKLELAVGDIKVAKGSFKLKLTEDETKPLDVSLTPAMFGK